jgi:hypothetical protein
VGIAKSILTRVAGLGVTVAWRFSAAIDMDDFSRDVGPKLHDIMPKPPSSARISFPASVKVESHNQFS